MIRAFIAIALPDDLSGRLAGLDPGMPGLRWAVSRRPHLTLCFLGNIDETAVERLKSELSRVRQEPFPAGVRGLGTFGGKRGCPLVVWAGIDDPAGALNRLQAGVVAAVRAAGIDYGDRPFRPHVTLGRSKKLRRADLRDFLDANAQRDFGRFEVGEFALFSSVLGPQGADHRVLETFPTRRG